MKEANSLLTKIKVSGVTACAFLVVAFLALAMVFSSLENQFLEVIVEEIAKIVAIAFAYKLGENAKFVATAFALLELVFKFLLLYVLADSSSQEIMRQHALFVAVIATAAVILHICTGILYDGLGLSKGFIAAVALHVSYNFSAGMVEATTELAFGLLLLGGTLATCVLLAWMPMTPPGRALTDTR